MRKYGVVRECNMLREIKEMRMERQTGKLFEGNYTQTKLSSSEFIV